MVSLSSTEMLKTMFENYGFGSFLFSQLNMEQLERLQEIKPDFKEYLEKLFSGEIYDPESLSILEQKFKNNLFIHQPKVYELDLKQEQIDQLISTDNIDVLESGILQIVTDNVYKLLSIQTNLRKGDVIHAFLKGKTTLDAYYIYSETIPVENVYLRFGKLEIIRPILYMDMLGSTPVNYWENIDIPKLSFEFNLSLVFEKITWKKILIEKQNYLIGEFIYQKRKVYLMIPIDQFKTSAQKLAVALQLSTKTNFYTKDPKNIVSSHPLIFFSDLTIDTQLESDSSKNLELDSEEDEE
jgi:hypothetical protein